MPIANEIYTCVNREEAMEELHKALQKVVPLVGEGSQIFVIDNGCYHKFRIEDGQVSHTESHSALHVENGRGCLASS